MGDIPPVPRFSIGIAYDQQRQEQDGHRHKPSSIDTHIANLLFVEIASTRDRHALRSRAQRRRLPVVCSCLVISFERPKTHWSMSGRARGRRTLAPSIAVNKGVKPASSVGSLSAS